MQTDPKPETHIAVRRFVGLPVRQIEAEVSDVC